MMSSSLQSFGSAFSVNSTIHFGQIRYSFEANRGIQPPTLPASVSLTRRQKDVLRLLVQGYTNKQIALALNMGHGTVKVHVTALLNKLGVSGRTAAAVAGAKLLAASPPPATSARTSGISRSHPFGPTGLGTRV